jgi:Peptidase_C39 like family
MANHRVSRVLLTSLSLMLAMPAVASARTVRAGGDPVGQREDFDEAVYARYAEATAPTRAEKDKIARLGDDARRTGDWSNFDVAVNDRDARLGGGASGKIDHSGKAIGGRGRSAPGPLPMGVFFNFHFVDGIQQFPQETGYWCGPAAGKSILTAWVYRGFPLYFSPPNQTNLAGSMGTTESNGTGIYDWAKGMNGWIWANPNYAGGWIFKSASTLTTMRSDIRGNVDAQWGAGVNTVEKSNGWRYNGHPTGAAIRHFIATYGYDAVQGTMTSTDSAANSVWVGWTGAQPTFTDTDARIFNFINQSGTDKRGYSY